MSERIAYFGGSTGVHLRVTYGAHSDVGRRRRHNEDCWGARFPAYLVADGMGGHQAGDVASRMVVDTLLDNLPDGELVDGGRLSDAIGVVAQRLSRLGVGEGAPGSTLTGIAFSEHRGLPCARVFNIGDSRTYLLSGGYFEQISVDHSEVQELIDAGTVNEVEARALPHQNIITRALGAGTGPTVLADYFLVPAQSGDRWVLCSDGLSGEVTDALIEMVTRSVADPQAAAEELVSMALSAGGKDNVTVVVVDVLDALPPWHDVEVDEDTVPRMVASPSEDTLPIERGPRVRGVGWLGADQR